MYMDIIHENINSYEHQSLKHFKIGVGNHQSIQAYELKVIQASGHVIIKACEHGSTLSSWHVNLNTCDQ